MAEFDEKAATWDDNPERVQRAEIIGAQLLTSIDLSNVKTAMEYGSGTGLLSFALKDKFSSVVLMDESEGMTDMAKQKCSTLGISHFRPIQYNLLEQPALESKFDLIYILLTLHHINDTSTILEKFQESLNNNGYLVIMDLETEDGSFHEGDFHGHNGFDKHELEEKLTAVGFSPTNYEICYEIKNETDEHKKYPLFISISKKL
jgi:ubiquinone/menaquinone biosynthesis C-methylase UbiE